VDETAEEMLERFQKEEKIEVGLQFQKDEKLEARKSNRENKMIEATTVNRCPERVILLAPGVKVPWIVISRNHGGFKANDLHDTARKLSDLKLGKNFISSFFTSTSEF
jgi:hypothetical protein